MSLVTQTNLGVWLDYLRGAWRSKTVWFNALLLAILPFADQIVLLIVQLGEELPMLQPYLPENIYKVMGTASVFANIYLRFKTKMSLEAK